MRAVRPAGPNSQRDTVTELEEIYVTRQTAGKVMIHSSNRRGLALYEYLWLCNYNESNKGKDWHVEPAKYYIHQVIKKNDAKKKLEIEKAQDEAKAIIRSMTAEERVNHAKGLFPNAFSRLWSEEEVELKLIEIAKSNPQKILGLSEDLDAAISKAILDFQDHKVVDFKNKKWRYPDSEDVICEVRANESAMDALKRHLLSKKGRKDAENLSDALERAKKNDKQQNS